MPVTPPHTITHVRFLYEPTREEMAGALEALFAPHLGAPDVQALLDAFPCQVRAGRGRAGWGVARIKVECGRWTPPPPR